MPACGVRVQVSGGGGARPAPSRREGGAVITVGGGRFTCHRLAPLKPPDDTANPKQAAFGAAGFRKLWKSTRRNAKIAPNPPPTFLQTTSKHKCPPPRSAQGQVTTSCAVLQVRRAPRPQGLCTRQALTWTSSLSPPNAWQAWALWGGLSVLGYRGSGGGPLSSGLCTRLA